MGLLRAEDHRDVRAPRLMVHRLKGSHSGTQPLQPDEAKAIRAWLRERPQPPSAVLFPSSRGDQIARRTLDWLMKKYDPARGPRPPAGTCAHRRPGRASGRDRARHRRAGLDRLDAGLPRNPHIRIVSRHGGWITVSPLRARPAPESTETLKTEVTATWPMTGLLDMVKEADLRLGFTDALGSPNSQLKCGVRARPDAAGDAVRGTRA